MKTNLNRTTLSSFLLLGLLLLGGTVNTRATDRQKENNTTGLASTGSWVLGVVPTTSDIGYWDSRVATMPRLDYMTGRAPTRRRRARAHHLIRLSAAARCPASTPRPSRMPPEILI